MLSTMELHHMRINLIILFLSVFSTAECTELKARTGGAAVFYLPPFAQCGSYSLMNPNNHIVLTVLDSGDLQINEWIYGSRAYHEILTNGTIRVSLQMLTEEDTGTYILQPDGGMKCQRYFYSLSLTDVVAHWLSWNSWGTCSLTCGVNGIRERTRHCTKDFQCQGRSIDTDRERCPQMTSCPKAHWLAWESWSECSATCDRGTRIRSRKCSNPNTGCEGHEIEEPDCNDRDCQTTAWTYWTSWTVCSETCGHGIRYRMRKCLIEPDNTRVVCGEGASSDSMPCELAPCFPTEKADVSPRYTWTSWSPWSLCTKPCGTETKSRLRSCTDDENRTVRNSYCGNHNEETSYCNLPACRHNEGPKPPLSSPPSSDSSSAKDIGVTVPLSAIVGTVAVVLILVLLTVVIVLVTRLRRKNRKQNHDVTSGTVTARLARKDRRSSTKTKKVVSICDESSSHFYAEIDDDIIQKRNKSKSIVTLDNPYSDLPPKSASPFYQNPDVNSANSTSGSDGGVFLFGNQTETPNGPPPFEQTRPLKRGNGYQLPDDSLDGGYLTCTPESSQDDLDRKPKRYVKQNK